MLRPGHILTPSWRIAGRDVVVLAALLVVTLVLAYGGTARASTAGPTAKVAMSWEVLNRRALAEGTLPLWNPYQFGGRPHLADPDVRALYPPHIILRILPLALFFPVSLALHAWLAGAGTYFAARGLGAPRLASGAASGAVLCAGLVMPFEETAYSADVYRLAWLPAIAACALRSAERRAWLPRPELVAVVALGLIASALRPSYLLATIAGCYLFSAIWSPFDRRRGAHLLVQPLTLAWLALGLSAFQAVPTVRFWTTMRGARDLVRDVPPERPLEGGSRQHQAGIAAALRSPQGRGRVLSVCDRSIDGSDLVVLGLPGVGGQGGVVLADYARFANLVRGSQEQDPPRADLLNLLGVEYLVSCNPPDPRRWALMSDHDGVGIYRRLASTPRAFWTCAPLAVGRTEMLQRLTQSSYDSRLVLQPHLAIHVRWSAGLTERDRARLESELRLEPLRDVGDRTWEYNLLDRSRDGIAAIVGHPMAEDTHGIDRGALLPAGTPEATPPLDEPRSEWLMGAGECDHPPLPVAVRSQDRFDGTMIVDVEAPHDGMVFFSETYYPDRRAWVDGRRAPRMKVNLAFTGVRVPAGAHRIELKYDTRALWWGAGSSALALLVWLVAERRVRRQLDRRRSRAP